MNYTYLIAISLLSLKELNYDLFINIIIFIIAFCIIFVILIWYYKPELYDEYIILNDMLDTDKDDSDINTLDTFFKIKKENKIKSMPEDSDDEENISLSISDIKWKNKNENIIEKLEKTEKHNIIPLKNIINKDNINEINDLITLANYYDNKFLNKKDLNKEYLENSKLYKYDNEYYTINLEKIFNIKGPLIKLKKMVGLTQIKNDIIDLLLYYLINFTSDNNMMHMTLMGPPGCGKTKLAKIISQILNKMGILNSDKIIYAKSNDLIGQYVGQTGPKTQKVIDSAMGGILFIDEAYGLGSSMGREHNFGADCINVLNQNLSDNKNKFICIIAGYEDELEKLFFSVNPGLKRRFPFRFIINGYNHSELMKIFIQKIYKLNWKINDDVNLEQFFKDNYKYFKYFGGDIDTLVQNIKYSYSRRIVCNNNNNNILIFDDINNALEKLKNSKKENNNKSKKLKKYSKLIKMANDFLS
jgi:SpoVK/Ycf46/Vps4 family AAA+-type ATPase